jgi:hypothetical protein
VLSHACKAVEVELFNIVDSMASKLCCALVSGRGSDLLRVSMREAGRVPARPRVMGGW